MSIMTNDQLIKLAQYSPKLASRVYRDQQLSEAVQAWSSFQNKLTPVPKRGKVDHWNKRQGRYTPLYHYVYFEDVKQHVNEAMAGTGLTWRQIPSTKVPVQTCMLDKSGNPTGQLTVGEAVGIETVIMYKNGTPLASGYMSTTSTSTSPKDVGSASTYCRRYSLCIATGTSSIPDRDGEQQRPRPRRQVQPQVRPRPRQPRISQPSNNVPVIGNARGNELINLINKASRKQGQSPANVQQYVSHTYANNAPIQQMPMSRYASVKAMLKQYVG